MLLKFKPPSLQSSSDNSSSNLPNSHQILSVEENLLPPSKSSNQPSLDIFPLSEPSSSSYMDLSPTFIKPEPPLPLSSSSLLTSFSPSTVFSLSEPSEFSTSTLDLSQKTLSSKTEIITSLPESITTPVIGIPSEVSLPTLPILSFADNTFGLAGSRHPILLPCDTSEIFKKIRINDSQLDSAEEKLNGEKKDGFLLSHNTLLSRIRTDILSSSQLSFSFFLPSIKEEYPDSTSSPISIDASPPFSTIPLSSFLTGQNVTPHHSIILLENVDIFFNDEKGFVNGLIELLRATKKPIIVTTNKFDFYCF
jgi:hypothetical protein